MPSSASRPRRPAPDAPGTGATPDAPATARAEDQPAPPAAEKPKSRAGRNLPVAIGVGLAMGAVILVALLTVRQAWIGIVAICAVIGTWELFGALHRAAGIRLSRVPVLVGGQAMIWLAWPFGTEGILGGLHRT